LKFYQDALGLKEVRRIGQRQGEVHAGVFVARPRTRRLLKASKGRAAPLGRIVTYNWDEEKYGEDRYFGHLAYEVDDIYATCDSSHETRVTINRPPRDGPDGVRPRHPICIRSSFCRRADAKPPAEPWLRCRTLGQLVIGLSVQSSFLAKNPI